MTITLAASVAAVQAAALSAGRSTFSRLLRATTSTRCVAAAPSTTQVLHRCACRQTGLIRVPTSPCSVTTRPEAAHTSSATPPT